MRTPPRLARWLVDRALPLDSRRETIAADLHEEFDVRARRSAIRARLWYWRAALGVALAYERRHGASSMNGLAQDLRFAIRTLRKSPGFTAAALTTLAVGIGASTAIFSMLNAVVLRPLPFADPDRLVFLAERDAESEAFPIAFPNFVDWKRELRSYTQLSGYGQATFNLTGDGSAERLPGLIVNWDVFRMLGVAPLIGRDFEPADDLPGTEHRVLISEDLWTRRFGADPSILGRRITMDGHPPTVIGVMPSGFRLARRDHIYEPFGLRLTPGSGFHDRGNHSMLYGIGRLKPGVTLEAAREELTALTRSLEKAYPVENGGVTGLVQPLAQRIVGDLRPALMAMFAAVGFLLLIACVNVTNLQVARGAARQHEMAVRAALGGGRARLVRQLIVESLLLSAAGGVLGVAVGAGLLKVLLALAPEGLPRLDQTSLDGTALLFAAAAVLLAGAVFGVLPAIQASRGKGQPSLTRASRNAGGAASIRLRRVLIVAETALALIMLTGAGLMLRTMQQLSSVDLGFTSSNVATARITISDLSWQAPQRWAFFSALEERVAALPGVTHAALALSLPIEGSNWGSVFLLGDRPAPLPAQLPSAAFSPITTGYFAALDMRIVEGRGFERADYAGTQRRPVIVNQTFARRFWPQGGAVGQRIKQGFTHSNTPWREIVGVVNDVKLNGVAEETPLQVYTPLAHDPARNVAIIARTSTDADAMLLSLANTVKSLNADFPVYNLATMESTLAESLARERVTAVVMGVFAAVALLLASVGLYGVVSHGVTERTPEIGVRLALGATPPSIVRMFLRTGLMTAAVGVAIGGAGAWWLTQFLEDLLFGVPPRDAFAFAGGAIVLLAVALVSCYLPATRASRVSPSVALRGNNS